MRYVPPTQTKPLGAPMSVLGFGCAGLLGRASRKESETAVAAALDAGITFFDTARSYGYGASEGLLGKMLAGRRHQAVICTKFGILPAERNWKTQLMPVARKVLKAFPGLRKAAQRQAGTQFVPGQFSVATLTSSFETSLRELRTDYVDMLILHAAPARALAQDDLLEALARLVESGKVRMAGISAELPVIATYFARRPPILTTAQFALNASLMDFVAQTKPNGDLLLVANHPYGGPGGVASTRERLLALADSPALPDALRAKVKDGAADPQMLPELLLNMLLSETGVSAVVPAMLQIKNLHSNVRAIDKCRFSPKELSAMRAALVAQPADNLSS